MLNLQKEIWKDVKGFEGRYKISSHGRVASIFKKHCYLISPAKPDSGGYYNIALRFKANGIKRYCVRIHQLVAEHFLEKPITSERLEIDHDDCDRLNNYYKNLKWVTSSEHRKITMLKGEILRGENHAHSKLTELNVIEMRKLYATNQYTHKELAEIFGICRRQAGDIINKVNWSWLV